MGVRREREAVTFKPSSLLYPLRVFLNHIFFIYRVGAGHTGAIAYMGRSGDNLQGPLSLSTLWVSGLEPRFSGLAADTFAC